jgi:hypothetical protein
MDNFVEFEPQWAQRTAETPFHAAVLGALRDFLNSVNLQPLAAEGGDETLR